MKELKPIEFKNERIITTKLLAESYETDENNIKNNFNNHKDRFIEGKHYYYLTGEELKAFRLKVNEVDLQISSMARSLYLWTEKGVLRHAKILDTDKAWEVYEELEDTYFRVKENQLQLQGSEISKQIAEIVQTQLKEQFSNQAEMVDNKYSYYIRPTALSKTQIVRYIKGRLGIDRANDEYLLVKRRIMIILNAKKWEDVPVELLQSSLSKIDECIDVIKKDRPYQQLSLI